LYILLDVGAGFPAILKKRENFFVYPHGNYRGSAELFLRFKNGENGCGF
jgi:hypothetical protein